MADVELSTLGSVIKTAYEGQSNTNAFTDAEKTKLSGIEASADITDATNVAAAGAFMTASDTSDDITEGTTNLFFTAAEQTKLSGIATGATANETDAYLLSRANHTGAQAISTVTGLQTALDGKLATDGEAATVATISGLISQGTNVTISGLGTSASPYVISATAGGSGVADGDKGDITVSSSGTVWTIDSGAVTLAKFQDIATSSILGRATASTGSAEVLTAAQVRTIINVADGAEANTVDSVNSQTGAVVLDADDIGDAATTNKFTTAADISKLAGIETGADVTDTANVTAAGAFMTATDTLDDITAGTTNKHFTATDETKLDGIEASATANPNAVDSDPTGVTGADATTNQMSLTQAEYDAITPNSATLYFITDAT